MIIIDFILILLLELITKANLINTVIVPPPSNILLQSNLALIIKNFNTTLMIILIVFMISTLVNMILVVLIQWLEIKYLEHILYRMNTIPRILITLIGIAILGVGYKTIIIVSILSSMPNFIITILGYLRNESNKSFIEAAKDAGSNDLEIIIKILIPTNIKGIIISLKILFSNIINSIIIGEYLIGTKGIGSLLQYNLFMYNMKNVWMITIIIVAFSVIISKMFNFILNSKKLWFNL